MSHDAVPKPLLNLLLMIVAQSREGMTLAAIKSALSPTPPDHVLLKALGALVDTGRLARAGTDPEATYRVLRPGSQGNGAVAPAATDVGTPAPVATGGGSGPTTPIAMPPEPGPGTSVARTGSVGPSLPQSLTPSPLPGGETVPDEERNAVAAVAEIFEATITTIVGARMSASTSTMLFQRAVTERIPTTERRACLVLLKAKLDQFSAADAARYEIDPETYRAWRDIHEGRGMGGVSTAGGPTSGTDTENGGEPSTIDTRPGTTAPAVTPPIATPATAPRRRRPRASTSPATPEPAGIPPQMDQTVGRPTDVGVVVARLLERVLQPGQSDVYLKRVLVSGIGVAVSLVLLYIFDNPAWGYLVLPLAAAPGLMVGGRRSSSQKSEPKEVTSAKGTEITQGSSAASSESSAIGTWRSTSSLLPQASAMGTSRSTSSAPVAQPLSLLRSPLSLLLSPRSLLLSPPSPTGGSPSRRWFLPAACVLVLLVIATLLLALRGPSHPSLSHIEQHLLATLHPLPVRVAELRASFATPHPFDCIVRFDAVLETTSPLYKRTPEALATVAGPNLATIEAAAALLQGPSAARIRSGVAMPEPAPSLSSLVVVTPSTPAGTRLPYAASLIAVRAGRGWSLGPVDRPLDHSRLVGEPKPAGAFAVDSPADLDALKRLLAQHLAYAEEVRRVGASLAADLARERQQRVDTLLQLVQPGTLFTGSAVHPSRTESHRVVLEITDASPVSGRVGALLRNDGGWSDARRFQGNLRADPDADLCTVTLRSLGDQRLSQSGPLLEQHGEVSLTLDLHPDGSVVATASGWNIQLVRLSPADAVELKTNLTRELTASLAATRPGMVYRGVAIPRQGAGADPLLLRFTEQDATGALLVAQLESTTADGWRRTFRGMIVDDTYRAGSTPIRLRSADSDRVTQANRRSVLGYQSHEDNLELSLRIEGTRLIGETDLFTFRFEKVEGDGKELSGIKGQESDPASTGSGTTPSRPAPSQASAMGTSRSTSDLPAYPTTTGAYVLTAGHWEPLPVVTPERTQAKQARQTNLLLGAIEGVKDVAAGRVPDLKPAADALILSVPDNGPVVPAGPVVIVYIGTLELPPAATHDRAAAAYPVMEMAATQLGRDGRRVAPLVRVLPGLVGFGSARLSATVEQPTPGVTLLRSTGPVSPALYAIACGSRTYELTVR